MTEYIPRVGDSYLVTTERYHIDRIMTIVAVTDERVYWDLEHRTSTNTVALDGRLVAYYDAIDKCYFDKFAKKSGLHMGQRQDPTWEV